MRKTLTAFAAIAAVLVLSPAHAACVKNGHIHSMTIDSGGTSTFYLRESGPASTVVFSFAITDDTVLAAAMAAIPGRSRVYVNATGLAVCSNGAGAAPIATQIFVTP